MTNPEQGTKTMNINETTPASMEQLLASCKPHHLERIAQLLEHFGDKFRVLRALDSETLMVPAGELPEGARKFLVIDTESTGLDAQKDRIVELGMLEVAYDPERAVIFGVTRVFDELEDPGMPISPGAMAVHGITDEMVAGLRINDEAVSQYLVDADFVVCHNSGHDRPLLEGRWPAFSDMPFVCSMAQVPWADMGIRGTKLEFIAAMQGFFYTAHRAEGDCFAVVKALMTPMQAIGGQTPFPSLLAALKQQYFRIWATNAPYDVKDVLRTNGYFWSDGTAPCTEKAWNKTVAAEVLQGELDWLKKNGYAGRSAAIPVDTVDSRVRFSTRRGTTTRTFL